MYQACNAIDISEDGIEIPTSLSGSVPSPNFPQIEFLPTEVVNQSQKDFSSISDMLHLREIDISLKKGSYNTDLRQNSTGNPASHEEMRETRDFNVSAKPQQSTRDSSTIPISINSNVGKTVPGTKDDNSTALQLETDISFNTEGEMHPEAQFRNNTSVMSTDVQALTVLQDLVSGDFQAKNTHSTEFLKDREEDTAFQLIQKIHNQLQQVQWDLQRLHLLYKYGN